jgi:hypothetical protein
MAHLFLLPVMVVITLTIGAGFGLLAFFSHGPVHGASHRGAPLDLEAQRHLATCYRIGCNHAMRSKLLSCAWRLVIVEDTMAAPSDLAEARFDCDPLDDHDRHAADRAKEHLRHYARPKSRRA